MICFAAATPFVAAYLRRASLERAVLVSLALVLVAAVVWRIATARIAAAPGPTPSAGAADSTPVPADNIALLPPWRRWDVWLLVAAFGSQSFSY